MHFNISKGLYVIFLAVLLSACASEKSSSGGGGGTATIPEIAYCSSVSSFSPSSTVTGSAVYQRRLFHATQGLGAVDSTTYPIRRAEIRVLSGATLIQCGETDNAGNFSISLPQNSSTYTIQVNSRGANSYVNTSVLTDPTNNTFYSLTASVVPSANTNIGTLTAAATGTVLGGAFNIFDQILRANEFLRIKTASCGALCTTFTVAPKSYVYWMLGFNPGTYVGTSSGLSFYSPGESQLYILGGLNGDPDNTDTDHFDNTVILHEYGHFIEDNYSKTNSPGGSHSGSGVIDPRLAWGEGWANFLGTYVNAYYTGDVYYRDTKGNTTGSSYGYAFGPYNLDTTSLDTPNANAGEGNFREFAISKSLWDSVDKTADTGSSGSYNSNPGGDESIAANFYEFWAVLNSHFPSTSYHFRNFGLFMELQNGLSGKTDISSILSTFQQKANRSDYALPITAPNGTCSYTIQSSSPSTSFANSNQYRDNDFYQYTHPGGSLTLTLNHNGASDLDLYLYTESYTYGSTSTMAGASNSPSGTSETITVSNLAAGTYMINVMVYSGTGSNTYTLTKSGAGQLCP